MRTDTGRKQSKIGMTKEPTQPIDLQAIYKKVQEEKKKKDGKIQV